MKNEIEEITIFMTKDGKYHNSYEEAILYNKKHFEEFEREFDSLNYTISPTKISPFDLYEFLKTKKCLKFIVKYFKENIK